MVNAIYYSAPWCQPCKSFKPVAIPQMVDAGIEVVEVNVDENVDQAAADSVMTLPTIIFWVRGQVDETIARVNGASQKQLNEALDKAKEYVV